MTFRIAIVLGLLSAACAAPSIEGTEIEGSTAYVSSKEKGKKSKPDEADPRSVGLLPADTNEQSAQVDGELDESLREGDILEAPAKGSAIASNKDAFTAWPGGVVPFVISAGLPNQKRVTDAIKHWERRTAIKFVPRTDEADYVEFVRGNGCSSFIGMQRGRQPINLAGGCPTGAVIHEIGHAVGLWHEQSRSDRDAFVTINLENVITASQHNFRKTTFQSIGAYDLGSIMHYESSAFSKNGRLTMTRLDGSRIVANRSALSSGDIAGIEALYGKRPPPDPAATTVLTGLNLRTGPGTQFDVIRVMAKGDTVTRSGASQSGFDAVTHEGTEGWAFSEHLEQ